MPAALLFLLLLGIFVFVVTPVLAVYALVKHARLRDDLETLREENRKQAFEHRRRVSEIAELTARLHKLETSAAGEGKPSPSSTVASTSSAAGEATARPKAIPTSASSLTAPDAVSVPGEDRTDLPRIQEKLPATSPPVSPPPKSAIRTPAPKTPGGQPQEPNVVDPPPAEKPAVVEPERHPLAPVLQPSAARISIPVAVSLRHPAPQPSLVQKIRKVSALEETVGRDWLNKLGIVILVVGVAFFGIYEFSTMGATGKAAISFLAAVTMLTGGIAFERRESYGLLGRTLIGGGWALLFFSSYGIHHVAAMRVLDSLTLDSLLMLLVAAAMGAHTLRYRSQLVTGLAFLLAYTTVALSHDTVYSLSAGVFLAIGLVVIVLKMSGSSWKSLESCRAI